MPGVDRELGAGQPLGVRGNPVAEPVRLLDERRDLLAGHLRGIRVLELDRARAGRHQLDEVRAVAELLAHGAADVVRAVGLAVHPGEEAPARARRGDDPPAGQQARPAERAEPHRLARLDDRAAEGADVAHGRHPAAQGLGEVGRDDMRGRAGQQRLGALVRLRQLGLDVRMRVDEPRHQRAPLEVDRRGVAGRRVRGARDELDPAVADEHRRALARRRARAVQQARVGQPEGRRARRGSCEEGRQARGHAPHSTSRRRGYAGGAVEARCTSAGATRTRARSGALGCPAIAAASRSAAAVATSASPQSTLVSGGATTRAIGWSS